MPLTSCSPSPPPWLGMRFDHLHGIATVNHQSESLIKDEETIQCLKTFKKSSDVFRSQHRMHPRDENQLWTLQFPTTQDYRDSGHHIIITHLKLPTGRESPPSFVMTPFSCGQLPAKCELYKCTQSYLNTINKYPGARLPLYTCFSKSLSTHYTSTTY